MTKRSAEKQISGFLKEADSELSLKEPYRKLGFNEAAFYI